MVDTVGIVDEQPYPGPPDGAKYLTWDNPLADIKGAIAVYWDALVTAYEPLIIGAFKPLVAAFDLLDEASDGALAAEGKHHLPPVKMASGRPAPPRHVGPRPARAFDPRGRRKF